MVEARLGAPDVAVALPWPGIRGRFADILQVPDD